MSEAGGNGSAVRYFCTAGSGMELFLVDEVKRKLSAEDVSVSIMAANMLFTNRDSS